MTEKLVVNITTQSGELLARLEARVYNYPEKPFGALGKELLANEIEKVAKVFVHEKESNLYV